jgi:hypothetical protein
VRAVQVAASCSSIRIKHPIVWKGGFKAILKVDHDNERMAAGQTAD